MPMRCFLLFLAFHAAAQDSSQSPEFKIRTDVELVLLDVSVKNPAGGYVTGLTKDQFQVYENGVAQKISAFSVMDEPVAVGLVMDDSGSMASKRASVIAAGVAFVEASNPNTLFAKQAFGFAVLKIEPNTITVRFVDKTGTQLYETKISKD